jgi:Ca-activated chloride channel homolog
VAPSCAADAAAAGNNLFAVRDFAPRRSDHPALGAKDNRAGDRRFWQHARDRRETESNDRRARSGEAGTAAVVQAPTLSRDDVYASIDRFQMQRGTATGSGIVLSLATIFPDAGIDLSQITGARNMPTQPGDKPKKEFTPVEPGSYASAAIIMLTDGQRTTGPDPLDAAKMASERGVRVYTVGIGTKEGETIGFEGWSMRVRLDEDTLKNIADRTRADYFYAGTAEDLKKVYQSLSTRLVVERKETEISALFALLGALLLVSAAGLSVWWFGRAA